MTDDSLALRKSWTPGKGGTATLIAQLETELRAVWAEPGAPEGAPKSRVCTMNLEVIAGSRELLERYMPVVDEVAASFQARAIVASIEPDAAGDEITGACTAIHAAEDGTTVRSERIVLHATGTASIRTVSAIEAFLVPEIPTVLVWLGRVHVDDPVFEELANDAHRIILDSDYTSLASLIHVASWARVQANRPHVSDLAWTRLSSWLELVARFFDGNDTRGFATKVTKVIVKQASAPNVRLGPEAALLLGWIATRLEWKISRLGGTLRFRRPDGTLVSIELGSVPLPKGVQPSTIAFVAIEAVDAGSRMSGSVDRDLASGAQAGARTPDADTVVWKQTVGGNSPIEMTLRLGANKAARWLERTLHRPAVDAGFDEAVAFAEQIVEDGLTVS